MLFNKGFFILLAGYILVLQVLTGCQPGFPTPQTTHEALNLPGKIGGTGVVVETVGVMQPTIKPQSVQQLPAEQEQPAATQIYVGPAASTPTAAVTITEPSESSPTPVVTTIKPTASSPTAVVSAVESAESPPTEESVSRILLIDYMADWDDLTYIRLIDIAASKGIRVDIFDNYEFVVDDRYDGIIVFGGGGGYHEKRYGGTNLTTLFFWITGPNRFVYFVLPRLSNSNRSLWGECWTYCLTVESEYLTPPGQDEISVPGGVLSELWSGLEIGSKTAYDEVSLQTYFDSPLERYTSMSNLDGVQRKTSILGNVGQGEYLYISNFATGDEDIQYRNQGNFLHDGNIYGWDNQKAAEILIDWLVGKQ